MRSRNAAVLAALMLGGCAHPLSGMLSHLMLKKAHDPPSNTICSAFMLADVPPPPLIPDGAYLKGYLNQSEYDALKRAGITEVAPIEAATGFAAYIDWLRRAGEHDQGLYKRSVDTQTWCKGQH